MSLTRDVGLGALAGAAGTVALNVLSNLDMTVRARPSSQVPSETAERLAEEADVDLGQDDQTEQHRSQGLGALLGYVVGVGFGALYGAVRPRLRRVPLSAGAAGLGAVAMAGSDVPATLLGVTDPRTWGLTGWLSDIVPHLAYGAVTAITYEAVADG